MTKSVAIVGGGPAGLIAAERCAQAGLAVTVYDRMPAVGRKFMLAGRGGLNLTHSESFDILLARYGSAADWLEPALRSFPPEALRAWCDELGETTFVGSSGRVFPSSFRATPLLRTWLGKLAASGVLVRPRHEWHGWSADGALAFTTPDGLVGAAADATLLALGGASWPKVGSTGTWVSSLARAGIGLTPLRPANCGFTIDWSDHFRSRFAGVPLKNVRLTCGEASARGEAMITNSGIEGGAVYMIGAAIREAIERDGEAELLVDLQPDMTRDALAARLAKRRKGDSLSSTLKRLGFGPVSIGLAHEVGADAIATNLKSVPLQLLSSTSIDRAISTAGGIALSEVGPDFSLYKMPSVFVAGEMLDWEAPTGGYLLQACFSTGVAAAAGIVGRLSGRSHVKDFPPA